MLVLAEPAHRRKNLPYTIVILMMVCYGLLQLLRVSDFESVGLSITMFKNINKCNKMGMDPEHTNFLRAWCLQQKHRIDWKYLLSSCSGHTQWSPNKDYWSVENITTAVRSYISYKDIRPAGQFSRFFIRSVAYDGTLKRTGGDYWRVHVKGNSSVPVTTIDHKNGSYEAFFLIVEPGNYKADIYLDYTMCDGVKDPPPDWIIKGNAQGKYQPPDALPGQEKPFLIEPLLPMLTFNVTKGSRNILKEVHGQGLLDTICPKPKCLLMDGFGRWKKESWVPYIHEKWKKWKRKGKRRLLWIYGDSVGDFLFKSIIKRKLCTSTFKHCEHTYNWIYKLKNNNITRAKLEDDKQDFSTQRILYETDGALRDPRMDNRSAIVLNYGLHYVEGISFKLYRNLIDNVIKLIYKHKKDPHGFHGKIIWKTTTALFKERYGNPRTNARHAKGLRFLTVPRVLLYNAYATSAMCKAGVDVIDVYPMSDSYPSGTGSSQKKWDAVHYRDEAFRSVEEFLEHYFSNES